MGEFYNFLASPNAQTMPQGAEAVLFNVVHHAATPQQIRRTLGLTEKFGPPQVFIDSGGFELLQAQLQDKHYTFMENRPINDNGCLNLTPRHVVEAVTSLKAGISADLSMASLDFPIRKYADSAAQEKEFLEKLGYNLVWAEKTARLRQQHCPEVQLFIPVQAYDLPQFEVFYSWLSSRGVPFDGLCMPLRNLKLAEVLLFLARFQQIGIKNVHLLGSSPFFIMALGAYMARHHFAWLSLDATNWQTNARFGIYMNPYDLSNESLAENVVIDETIVNDCACPWCRGMTFTGIKNLPRSEQMALLVQHNHWVMEEARKALIQHARDVPTLERYLVRVSKRKDKARDLCTWLSLFEVGKGWDIDKLAMILRP